MLVDTPQGARHIKKEDLDFAARARDMERENAKRFETPEFDAAPAPVEETHFHKTLAP